MSAEPITTQAEAPHAAWAPPAEALDHREERELAVYGVLWLLVKRARRPDIDAHDTLDLIEYVLASANGIEPHVSPWDCYRRRRATPTPGSLDEAAHALEDAHVIDVGDRVIRAGFWDEARVERYWLGLPPAG